jgi:hypothetical protein
VNTGVHGAPRAHVPLGERDRHNPRLWILRKNSPGQFFSRHVRQQQVERNDVGPIPPDIVEGLFTTRSDRYDRHVVLTINSCGQAFLN